MKKIICMILFVSSIAMAGEKTPAQKLCVSENHYWFQDCVGSCLVKKGVSPESCEVDRSNTCFQCMKSCTQKVMKKCSIPNE
jgi:hypothetical protein